MYRESLLRQWENLIADFSQTHCNADAEALDTEKLNSWYEQRIKCFSSLVMLEGIELDQQNNPEFARELREKIAAFRFLPETNQSGFSVYKTLAVNLLPGIALGLLTAFCTKWFILWPILLGVIMVLAGVLLTFSQAHTARGKSNERLTEKYAQQLEQYYATEISDILNRHNIIN